MPIIYMFHLFVGFIRRSTRHNKDTTEQRRIKHLQALSRTFAVKVK